MTDSTVWVPEACTLPTAEQPLRVREFDDLFASEVLSVRRETPTRTRLALRADENAASRAAALAVKETGCCSFFAFDLAVADGEVTLGISASPDHQDVLAALTDRAEAAIGSAA